MDETRRAKCPKKKKISTTDSFLKIGPGPVTALLLSVLMVLEKDGKDQLD
jgi:hypothetical protein